jgi:uncharacterized membrane protein YGL010W
MRHFKFFSWFQTCYILVTALWPLIDIRSFMIVTGPKTDLWLVKTVASLLIVISCAMIAHLQTSGYSRPLFVLGVATAFSLLCIDIYYSLNDIISDVYLIDGAAELLFVIGWIYYAVNHARQESRKKAFT